LTIYEAVNIDNRSIQVSAFHGDPVTTSEISDQIASRFGGTPRVELNLRPPIVYVFETFTILTAVLSKRFLGPLSKPMKFFTVLLYPQGRRC
jgi:hypothetical protein